MNKAEIDNQIVAINKANRIAREIVEKYYDDKKVLKFWIAQAILLGQCEKHKG